MDKPTTDPATRVAARLAAEIIKQMDTLTAEQVGIIAHTLGMDPEPVDVDHLRYLGKLKARGVEYKPYAPCRDTFTPDPSTAYTCSRARHDDGNHDWVRLDFWTTVQRHDRADPR